jgi:hypothetical protein
MTALFGFVISRLTGATSGSSSPASGDGADRSPPRLFARRGTEPRSERGIPGSTDPP